MSLRVTRARWDVAAKRAAALSVARDYLPTLVRLFPHAWDSGVRVTFRYSTDVTICRAGNEERVALWGRPQREIELSLVGLSHSQSRRMREAVLRHCHESRLVPLYHDVVVLDQATDVSDTVWCATSGRDFHVGGLVVIFETDYEGQLNTWEVAEIATVSSEIDGGGSGLTLTSATANRYIAGRAAVIPIISCDPATSAESTLPTSGPGAAMTLSLTEQQGNAGLPGLILPGNWPTSLDTYDQVPIIPAWAGLIDGTRSGVTRGGSVGPEGRGTRVDLSGDRPRETFDIQFAMMRGDSERLVVREIIDHMRGRLNPVWCLHRLDLEVTAIGATTIDVTLPTTLEEFERFFAGHVGLDYRDGRTNIYQVDTITEPTAGTARLTLAQTVPINRRNIADVVVCAPALLVRGTSDEVSLEFRNSDVAVAALPVIELHREGRIEIHRVNETITPTQPDAVTDLFYWGRANRLLETPAAATPSSDGDDIGTWADARGTGPSLVSPGAIYHEFFDTETGKPIRAVNNPLSPTAATYFELQSGYSAPWSNAKGLTVFMLVKVRDTDATPDGLRFIETPDSLAVTWSLTTLDLRAVRNGVQEPEYVVTTPDITLPREAWTLVAFTWRPGKWIRVYQHGILVGEANGSPSVLADPSPTAHPRVFLANNPNADALSSGDTMIRDVVIYSRALEASEIDGVGEWLKNQPPTYAAPVTGVAWQRIH